MNTLDDLINQGNKDALLQYAQEKHGVTLANTLKFETLVTKVRELDEAKPTTPTHAIRPAEPRETRWLRNPKTDLRFPYTERLAARGDLVLCDPPEPDEAAKP